MLSKSIAAEIVKETMIRLNKNINIFDTNGIIIATGDEKRLHCFHEGALYVVKTGKTLVITEENLDDWKGSKKGINFPLYYNEEIIGVVGISGEKEDVEEFAELVKMTTELMIKQSVISTKEEWKKRASEDLFDLLIQHDFQKAKTEHFIELLNITLQPPLFVILINTKFYKQNGLKVLKSIKSIFPDHYAITGALKTNMFFVLCSAVNEEGIKDHIAGVSDLLNRYDFQIATSSPKNQLQDIHYAYEEAKLLLDIQLNHKKNIIFYSDHELEVLLMQSPQHFRSNFLQRTIKSLDRKYIETLEVFFKNNLTISSTSRELFIHRNTLLYRLNSIHNMTNLDPQVFYDSMILYSAIILYYNETESDNNLE